MKNKQTQHTPTPWKIDTSRPNATVVRGSNELLVAECVPEDAAFIVRAVNSHEAVIGHLESIRDNVRNIAVRKPSAKELEIECHNLADYIHRVIVQAEEK
jgi:hypothetical protein